MSNLLRTMLIVLFAGALPITPTLAYVGPGAGLSLVGAVWGLLAAVLTAVGFIVLWPIRKHMRRKRIAEQAAAASMVPANEESTSRSHDKRAPHGETNAAGD